MKKQNNKTKGDFLENIYYLFEKSLQSIHNTTIKRKHKITCSKGVEREIDIYVEVPVDKIKVSRFAIECKNKKKGVSVGDIDSLVAKIKDKPIKGIFVTTSYYQTGVIKYAEAYDIKLLKFEQTECKREKEILLLKNKFEIENISFNLTLETQKIVSAFQNCPDCKKAFDKLVESYLPGFISNIDIIAKAHDPYWGDAEKMTSFSKQHGLTTFSNVFFQKPLSMTHENHKIEVTGINVSLIIWKQTYKVENVEQNNFSILDDGKVIAKMQPMEFKIGNGIFIGSLCDLEENEKKGILSMKETIEYAQAKNVYQFKPSKELNDAMEKAININKHIEGDFTGTINF